jgi:hypothetical protein
MTKPLDLHLLTTAVRERNALDDHITRLIIHARSYNASWAAIGDALGVTRQAAHKAYSASVADAERQQAETPLNTVGITTRQLPGQRDVLEELAEATAAVSASGTKGVLRAASLSADPTTASTTPQDGAHYGASTTVDGEPAGVLPDVVDGEELLEPHYRATCGHCYYRATYRTEQDYVWGEVTNARHDSQTGCSSGWRHVLSLVDPSDQHLCDSWGEREVCGPDGNLVIEPRPYWGTHRCGLCYPESLHTALRQDGPPF